MDPVVSIVVSYALAMLWIVAATQKLLAFPQFSATLADYRLVPDKLIVASAGLVIVIEVGLGVGLLFAAVRGDALVGSAGLLALYAGAMGINLARGRRHIDCGCMGPAARQSLSGWLIGRNLLLALAALLGLQATVPRELYWLDLISVAAAVSALVLIYAAINHLIANAPDLARLRN